MSSIGSSGASAAATAQIAANTLALQNITGQLIGTGSTYATLPTSTDLTADDWAFLNTDDIGTGTAQAPQYPKGVYVYDGTDYVFGFATGDAEHVTTIGNHTVDTTDPLNPIVSLAYIVDGVAGTTSFTFNIPSPVSVINNIDLTLTNGNELSVTITYIDDNGDLQTRTDTSPIDLSSLLGPFKNPDGTTATQSSTDIEFNAGTVKLGDYVDDNHAISEVEHVYAKEADGTLRPISIADLSTLMGIIPRPITIEGYVITGQTLSVVDYGGVGGPVDSHQWFANNVAIAGATGTTYTVTPADEGKYIDMTVNGELSSFLKNFIPSDAGVEVWLDPAFDVDPTQINRGLAQTAFSVVGSVPPVAEAYTNGVQAMRVTNGYLQQAAGEFPDLNNLTVVTAWQQAALITDFSFKMNADGSGGRSQMHLSWSDGNVYFDVQGINDRFSTGAGFLTAGDAFITSYQNDPTDAAAFVYRSSNPSSPYANSSTFNDPSIAGDIQLGRSTNQTQQNRIMLDQIISARVMSSAAREKIEGYVAWKYGLEGILPVDHPYLSGPA